METKSGITVNINGGFIIISQIDALHFEKVIIAIPKNEFLIIKNYVDAKIGS